MAIQGNSKHKLVSLVMAVLVHDYLHQNIPNIQNFRCKIVMSIEISFIRNILYTKYKYYRKYPLTKYYWLTKPIIKIRNY